MEMAVAWVVGSATLLGALAAIAKFLHLGEAAHDIRNATLAINGQDARPGFDRVPGLPERMQNLEERQRQTNHDLRGEISSRLTLLEENTAQLQRNGGSSVADAVHEALREIRELSVAIQELKAAAQENRDAIARLDERHNHTDGRITDHRRRSDETAAALRVELERRARDLHLELVERNKALDERLADLGQDVFRASAARAILTELGHKIEPDEQPHDGR